MLLDRTMEKSRGAVTPVNGDSLTRVEGYLKTTGRVLHAADHAFAGIVKGAAPRK
jgi:hypothetical protein